MWPFKSTSAGRVPSQRKESELAREAAERSLRESKADRAEVEHVSRLAKIQLEKNHISPRIQLLLKEGK